MFDKTEFIKFMIRSEVLKFGEFKLKSGRIAPYFINTGNYKTGSQIARLGSFYADCIAESISPLPNVLFGPAYKGIPLAVSAASALYQKHNIDVGYCFDRKEVKDHGEGGLMVGYPLCDGDRVVIIEDVITAGTAIREVIPKLKSTADVEIAGLVISVDRMERGKGDMSAIQEIYGEFGIKTYPLLTARDIISEIYNVEIDGRVVLDDEIRSNMESYLAAYGV